MTDTTAQTAQTTQTAQTAATCAEFRDFLRWERGTRDCIDLKRVYIDMAGDLKAAVMLSQIVYWRLPGKNQNIDGTRLRVHRHGHLWLVRADKDWWDEIRLNTQEARSARQRLKKRGLIICQPKKFGTDVITHIRIDEQGFLRAWREHMNAPSPDRPTTRSRKIKGGDPASAHDAAPPLADPARPELHSERVPESGRITPRATNRDALQHQPGLKPQGPPYTENTTKSSNKEKKEEEVQANVWSVSAFGSSSLNLSRNSKTRPVPDHALPARAASEVMTPSGRSEPLPASLPATTTPVPVRPPRRAQEARQAPGSVRSRLRGMLGGHSAFETYLSEVPASGVDRRKWLVLSHEQIEQAYQEAQQVRSEGRNFRTALLRALDVAVGAVIRPRAASGTGGAASAPPLNLASFAPAPKPAVDDAPRADGSSFRNSRWQAKKDAGRVVTVVQVDPNTNRVVLHDGVELNIVTLYLEYARVD